MTDPRWSNSSRSERIETTDSYVELFSRVIMKSAPAPLAVLTRGEGARVWDVDGTDYLDFLAGIAVNALGHAHPVFVEAVSRQAATLAHVSNLFATQPQLELAERLVRLTGGDRVFFCNSGAEAIEAAVKLARLTGKRRILALENAFHGRTMGSLSLTGKPALRGPFEPLLPGVEHLPSTIEALEQALAGGDVAALVVEPIKGEAGVVELPEGYLKAARELTATHGALLILDEIQTGAGRTGDWFAFQHEGIVPDAIALAKGIGGGFPIGAFVTFGAASELFGPGHHGSTFGGNPLAAAAANAVLGEIERAGLVENARIRGAELRARIQLLGSPLITDIQGRGLLLGIGLAEPVAGIVARRALDAGLIVNPASESRIRLAPPLIIGDDELHEFTRKFADALDILPTDHGAPE
ncbi:acetylornithine transaminase [Protaetiibacter larvae]|uniref:Acetylornithine aminotransferase n=1 Tax=Protaetiibacter larvae TaxID=2592654 RepID=A0A5C1Y732_9MICO|nr:acetylornithine transaminase [Protaetiibacter larvae]QEO09893.1 acetylornithine transaminase [Protaetiibacter larvae]